MRGNNPPEGASRVRLRRTRSRSEREVKIPRIASGPPKVEAAAKRMPGSNRREVRCVLLAERGPRRPLRVERGPRPMVGSTPGSGPYEPPLPRCGQQTVSRKGHEIVAPVFLKKSPLAHVNRRNAGDFVLCQGESGSGASLGACDGSGVSPCSSRCLADV